MRAKIKVILLWLASPHLYDPSKTKIIRYSLVDKKVFDNLHAELSKVFDDFIKEFIKQKLANKINSKNLPQAFKNLDDFVGSEIAKIKKSVCNEPVWGSLMPQVQII